MKDREYAVNEFDGEEIIDQRCYPTFAEAVHDLDTTQAPAEIEQWDSVWNDADGNLEKRRMVTVRINEARKIFLAAH